MTEVVASAPPVPLVVEPAAEGHTDLATPSTPRWADRREQAGPASLVVGHVLVPTEVAGALTTLASQLQVPEYTVRVAAHLKVISALTGEHRVAAALTVDGQNRVVDLA